MGFTDNMSTIYSFNFPEAVHVMRCTKEEQAAKLVEEVAEVCKEVATCDDYGALVVEVMDVIAASETLLRMLALESDSTELDKGYIAVIAKNKRRGYWHF